MAKKDDVPILIAQSGPASGQRWPLVKETITIGRGTECDIVIPDRQISRVHARLTRREEGFELEDLGSKNGTHVNGAPLEGPALLQDGDLIQVAFAAKLAYVGSEATMPLRIDTTPGGQIVSVGRLRLDSASRRVWVGAQELDPPLSVPQFRFLEQLYQRPGQVCSREELIAVVWPEAVGAGVSEQAIDALVRRLRDRLQELDPEHLYVATVRGHGFRLDNPPPINLSPVKFNRA
jgi:DNA-binding response OmpR family regulator